MAKEIPHGVPVRIGFHFKCYLYIVLNYKLFYFTEKVTTKILLFTIVGTVFLIIPNKTEYFEKIKSKLRLVSIIYYVYKIFYA